MRREISKLLHDIKCTWFKKLFEKSEGTSFGAMLIPPKVVMDMTRIMAKEFEVLSADESKEYDDITGKIFDTQTSSEGPSALFVCNGRKPCKHLDIWYSDSTTLHAVCKKKKWKGQRIIKNLNTPVVETPKNCSYLKQKPGIFKEKVGPVVSSA